MKKTLQSFIEDEKGEDLIEYGLLVAFVAGIALAALTNNGIRDALGAAFVRARNALSDVTAF